MTAREEGRIEPRLLSAEGVAAYLSRSPSWVTKRLRNTSAYVERFGRYDRAEIDRMIEAERTQGQSGDWTDGVFGDG